MSPVSMKQEELCDKAEDTWIIVASDDCKRYVVWRGPGYEIELLDVGEGFKIQASSGGLLLIEKDDCSEAYVGNPITGDWIQIPPCPQEFDTYWSRDMNFYPETGDFFILVHTCPTMYLYDSRCCSWKPVAAPSGECLGDPSELREDVPYTSDCRNSFLLRDGYIYNPFIDKLFKVPPLDDVRVLNYALYPLFSLDMERQVVLTVLEEHPRDALGYTLHVTHMRWDETMSQWVNLRVQGFNISEEEMGMKPETESNCSGRYLLTFSLVGGEGESHTLFTVYDQIKHSWYHMYFNDPFPLLFTPRLDAAPRHSC